MRAVRRPLGLVFAVVVAVLPAVLSAPPAHASADPFYVRQWGPDDVGAPAAWSRSKANGVTIAVVDSGVDVDHPDLKAKLVPGRDFGDNDDNPDDDSELKDGEGKVVHGHGTHVAGIAAAITDNNVGVAGVAPLAKIMPLKVFPSNPNGSLLNIASAVPSAIRYAVDNGARVINLSLGDILPRTALIGIMETPCADAYSRGALCVVASGNSGENNASGYKQGAEFLLVTAHDRAGRHAGFGQHADTQWALSAPGVDIYSTFPVELGSYATEQGTSMAAPHASGVAALLFAVGYSVGQVIERMLSTARPMGNPGVNGAGKVDAAAALGVTPPPPTTAPTQRTVTTRRATSAGATSGNRTGSATTQATIAQGVVNDEDLAFSGGPGGNAKLTQAGPRKKAKEVSDATMLVTLGALAVFGLGWGVLSATRRRVGRS
jgi:subtilisin family serine protease